MAFVLAHCQNCGEEVNTDDVPQPLRLFIVLAALQIHAAQLEAIMVLPEYDNAREGWEQKLQSVTDEAERETEEMQEFGEAYDGRSDAEDG